MYDLINRLKVGDLMESLKSDPNNSSIMFIKIMYIDDPDLIYLDRKVAFKFLLPICSKSTIGNYRWDYYKLQESGFKVIININRKRMLSLLYDG